jgi:hypothetical protein
MTLKARDRDSGGAVRVDGYVLSGDRGRRDRLAVGAEGDAESRKDGQFATLVPLPVEEMRVPDISDDVDVDCERTWALGGGWNGVPLRRLTVPLVCAGVLALALAVGARAIPPEHFPVVHVDEKLLSFG